MTGALLFRTALLKGYEAKTQLQDCATVVLKESRGPKLTYKALKVLGTGNPVNCTLTIGRLLFNSF